MKKILALALISLIGSVKSNGYLQLCNTTSDCVSQLVCCFVEAQGFRPANRCVYNDFC